MDELSTIPVSFEEEVTKFARNVFPNTEARLHLYKKRNLQKSHQERINSKVRTQKPCTRRLVAFNAKDRETLFKQGLFSDENNYPYYYARSHAAIAKEKKIKKEEKPKVTQEDIVESHETWVENRMKLHNDLKNLGLSSLWLKKKPTKSALESKVLLGLEQQEQFRRKKSFVVSTIDENFESENINCAKIGYEAEHSDMQIFYDTFNKKKGRESSVEKFEENFRVPNDLIERAYLMQMVQSALPKLEPAKKKVKNYKTLAEAKRAANKKYLKKTYMKHDELDDKRDEINLSTGRATVGPKVNCWMTYEEYNHINKNSSRVSNKTASYRIPNNAFWPGSEEGVRICYTPKKQAPAHGSSSVFASTKDAMRKRSNWGYDNDLREWPAGGRKGDITFGKTYVVSHR